MDSPDGTERPLIPPVVYLPCRTTIPGEAPQIEMRQLEDGRVALLAYTALDRMARCCGPHQPWALYPTEELSTLRRTSSYDVVVFDHELPAEVRHTGEGA